jgi:hypothetical protein
MPTQPDEIAISHSQRRKIEGGILIPFIETCREELGDQATQRALLVACSQKLDRRYPIGCSP